jgi:hypothetical protein
MVIAPSHAHPFALCLHKARLRSMRNHGILDASFFGPNTVETFKWEPVSNSCRTLRKSTESRWWRVTPLKPDCGQTASRRPLCWAGSPKALACMQTNLYLLCRRPLSFAIAFCCPLLFTVHQLEHWVAFRSIQCLRSGQQESLYHRLILNSVGRTFMS